MTKKAEINPDDKYKILKVTNLWLNNILRPYAWVNQHLLTYLWALNADQFWELPSSRLNLSDTTTKLSCVSISK